MTTAPAPWPYAPCSACWGRWPAAAFPSCSSFPATADGSEPKLHYAGYPHLGLAFGALMSLTGLIAFLGTLDYRTSGAGKDSTAPPFFAAFRISMQNAAFRSIWISTTVFFLAVVLNFSLAIQYFTWYARINGSGALGLIQTCFYVGAHGGRGAVDVAGAPHREAHPVHYGHHHHGHLVAVRRGAGRRRPAARHRPSLAAHDRARGGRHLRQRGLGGSGRP